MSEGLYRSDWWKVHNRYLQFPTDEFNMLRVLLMLLGDAVAYFLLALYIEGVFPG